MRRMRSVTKITSGRWKTRVEWSRSVLRPALTIYVDARSESQKAAGETASATTTSASDSAIKRILDRECTYRNRTTVLNANKKTFENVLKMIEVVNAETKEKIEKASKATLLAPAGPVRKEQLPLSRLVKEKIHGKLLLMRSSRIDVQEGRGFMICTVCCVRAS